MKKLICVILATALFTGLGAQDFLITLAGDTLRGAIFEIPKPNGMEITIKMPDGKKRILTPEEIIAYSIEGKRYEPFSIEGKNLPKQVFFQCHLKGEVSFYSSYDVKGAVNQFYLRMEEGDLEELKPEEAVVKNTWEDSGYKGLAQVYYNVLRRGFKACPTILPTLPDYQYSLRSFTKAFLAYYECVNQSYQDFSVKKTSKRPELAIYASLHQPLLAEAERDLGFSANIGFDIGAYANFFILGSQNKLIFQLNVVYTSLSFKNADSRITAADFLNEKYVHFPILMLKYFQIGSLNVHTGAGVDIIAKKEVLNGLMVSTGIDFELKTIKMVSFIRARFLSGASLHFGLGAAF
ncbi:MAG: hypothetical protein DHS20C18_27460 [Saprospiraceae bacterium]|nr:MAG: hypothetical protein DHS20C18_27460 [Saprospiraceae bacterium]